MIRIYVLLALLLLTTSCQQNETPKNESRSILRLNFASAPDSFNPRYAVFSNSINIYPFLYDGLYRNGPNGKPIPSLAESVEISPDGLHFTFHLKKTFWSNGDPVTAYDFEHAWKWMLTPTNPALYSDRLYVLKNGKLVHQDKASVEWLGVFAKDSDTLVVELEEPCPYFLDLLTQMSFYPIHRTNPDSTNGPFLLDEYVQDTHLKLIKNPSYWDAAVVKLEGMDITFVEDSNTELYLFEKGELDWAGQPCNGGIPLDALGYLQDLQKKPALVIFFYSFNVNHPLFKNKKVRQALNLAVDRDQIVEHITQGGDQPARTFILQKNLAPVPSDAELVALFQEGWEEEGCPPLSFTLSHNVTELQSTLAQFVHDRWSHLFGIKIGINAQEWKSHLHNLTNGLFDCTRCSLRASSNDPVAFLEMFEDPEHPMQHSNWSHSRFLELFQKGRKSNNPQERAAYLNGAIAIFNDESPVVPLFYPSVCYIKNPRLKNEVINSRGSVDFKWAYFE